MVNRILIKQKRMTKDVYNELIKHFTRAKDVTVLSSTGAQGRKFKGEIFAMFTKGYILLKHPLTRVDELVAIGEGLPYDAGTGKPMKKWVIIPETNKESWIKYSEKAKDFITK